MRRACALGLVFGLSVAGLDSGCAETCEPAPEFGLGQPTAWEQTFLETDTLPDSPAPTATIAEDGLALASYEWVPEGWQGEGPVVLFVHGSSAHGALYSVLGRAMADEGVFARLGSELELVFGIVIGDRPSESWFQGFRKRYIAQPRQLRPQRR